MNKEQSSNLFDNLKGNPNLKKPKVDYGAITVSALRRATKDFYTAQELADKLQVNVMTIYRYIKARKLKAYKIGKEYRIDQKEFESFLKRASTI